MIERETGLGEWYRRGEDVTAIVVAVTMPQTGKRATQPRNNKEEGEVMRRS